MDLHSYHCEPLSIMALRFFPEADPFLGGIIHTIGRVSRCLAVFHIIIFKLLPNFDTLRI